MFMMQTRVGGLMALLHDVVMASSRAAGRHWPLRDTADVLWTSCGVFMLISARVSCLVLVRIEDIFAWP